MTSRTALIMIDMQNMYLQQERRSALGWPPIWEFDRVVAECAALLEAARDAGVPVIYTRQTSRVDGADMTPSMRRLLRDAPADESPIGAEEEWGSAILDAVAPAPGDIVMEKHRWDAFFQTDLDQILRNLDVTRLIVAGLQTNVCVETTSRTGMMKNFDVAVPEDAVSTDGEALHRAALDSLRVLYVEVAPWRELLAPDAAWERRFTTPGYGRQPADMATIVGR
ncbi:MULTISPECIES: cysteine hydrolase family protein [Microbacterium]|uniref:cysteine hydrolase family protein n=1 Tax=Microbacterium TaxID=33882 RepID=UPI0027896915|nr:MULTISPECIES: isochorismatase family cysteine hydrolase [Microbacterium]MDQ1083709.1 ureidoacrylate peracid hydrolase [Microbacterium sp. SORGH_AS_0344]MDQ1171014.1 ureidoacrylate peracid hydrolase [Microbacterium proteolyticum]